MALKEHYRQQRLESAAWAKSLPRKYYGSTTRPVCDRPRMVQALCQAEPSS